MKKITFPIITFFILIIVTSSLTAQSIWKQVAPMPPPIDYFDVHFINQQEGWVVGEDGMLLHTSDGAQHWEILNTLGSADLNGVFFIDSLRGWVAGQHLYKTADGGKHWNITLSPVYGSFEDVYFFNADTGLLCSRHNGLVYRTTDGGQQWELTADLNESILQFYFPDNNTGWAAGYHHLFKTVNGSEDWVLNDFAYDASEIEDVFFLNSDTGWVSGPYGLYMQTSNGGESWDTVYVEDAGNTFAIRFYDENLGFLYANGLFRTIDGGNTWNLLNSIASINQVTLPMDDFICVARNGSIGYSNDQGNSWEFPYAGFDFGFYTAAQIPSGDLLIGGELGNLYRSNDLGLTWENQPSGTTFSIRDIFFIDENEGWMATSGGKILHSTNGGLSWNATNLGSSYDLKSIHFVDNNHGWTAGSVGSIFRTTDGGNNWQQLSTGNTNTFNDIFFISQTAGWIVGDDGLIFKTLNGGDSWEPQESGTDNQLFGSCFISETEGWICGMKLILHTMNGGDSWELQFDDLPYPYYTYDIFNITFTNDMYGWAIGKRGVALHTINGGQLWVPQYFSDDDAFFSDMVIADDEHGLLVGADGSVIYSEKIDYLAPWITTAPADTFVCEGTWVEIPIQAVGDSLQFQWWKDDVPIPGTGQQSLIFDSVQFTDGGLYACRVYSGAGSVKCDNFQINIKPRLKITASPQDITCHAGDTIILNQAVTGALPIHYQWQKNGVDIPGAVFHTLSFYGVQLSDSGYYRCVVSNDCNQEITEEAKLTVMPASGVEVFQTNNFRIIPNPARDRIRLEGLLPEVYDLKVMDVHGMVMIQQHLDGNSSPKPEIDISDLPPGLYFVKLGQAEQSYISRFLKI